MNEIIKKETNGIKIRIKVVPNASKCEITGVYDNALRIRLDVPPVEGKANQKCIKFLSKFLKVPKTNIEITSGDKSKVKMLSITGNTEEICNKLKDYLN